MTATLATVEDIEAVIERALARQAAPRLAWTVPETAASLGVSPDTVRRLIKAGHLPTVPHMGARQLVPDAALREFVSPGSTDSPAGSQPSLSLLRHARQAGDRGTVSTADGGSHPPSAA